MRKDTEPHKQHMTVIARYSPTIIAPRRLNCILRNPSSLSNAGILPGDKNVAQDICKSTRRSYLRVAFAIHLFAHVPVRRASNFASTKTNFAHVHLRYRFGSKRIADIYQRARTLAATLASSRFSIAARHPLSPLLPPAKSSVEKYRSRSFAPSN